MFLQKFLTFKDILQHSFPRFLSTRAELLGHWNPKQSFACLWVFLLKLGTDLYVVTSILSIWNCLTVIERVFDKIQGLNIDPVTQYPFHSYSPVRWPWKTKEKVTSELHLITSASLISVIVCFVYFLCNFWKKEMCKLISQILLHFLKLWGLQLSVLRQLPFFCLSYICT